MDDYPNSVITFRCSRQLGYEVHCDLFPLPYRYPFEIANFIDENLDRQMQKIIGTKWTKEAVTKKISPDIISTKWIDEFCEKQPHFLKKRRTATEEVRRIYAPEIHVG
jgi:hypothetical protein